jgi:hypothetical protein
VALTGRAVGLAALGLLPVLAVPSLWTVLAVALVLAAVCALDAWLAQPVGSLALSRSGATSCRLGEPAEVSLAVVNPGPRALHGVLRDAWVPSAGAQPRAHQLDVPAGERRVLTTVLQPTRAATGCRTGSPCAPSARSGLAGPAGPARAALAGAGAAAVHLPPPPARAAGPAAAARRVGRGPGPRPGHGVRRAARVGGRRRRAVHRLAGHRPAAGRRRAHLATGAGPPPAARRGQLAHVGRPVGRRPAAGRRPRRALLLAALASRAGDRVDLLAFDRQVRAAVEGVGRTELLPRMVDAMAGLEPALVESDGRRLVGEVLRRARRRSLVVLFTSLDTAPLETGLLPLLPSLTSRHTVLLAAVADPRVEQMARGGGSIDAVYDAQRPSEPVVSAGGSPPSCASAASRSSTRRPRPSLLPCPTPTWRSRRPAGCRAGARPAAGIAAAPPLDGSRRCILRHLCHSCSRCATTSGPGIVDGMP